MTDFSIDKLRNVILQFKIPMAFDVLNCMKSTDIGKPYIVTMNNIPAKIHFERIYGYRYTDEGFAIAPFSRMQEDRGGMLSYSNVQVWFDSQTFNSGSIDKSLIRLLPEQFIELSIAYVNKFIKIYKLLTGSFWLRPIIRTDVLSFHCVLVDTNGNQERIDQLISHLVEFNGGDEFRLPDDIEPLFRNALVSDDYDFGGEFLLTLSDNRSLGYYKIALVQAVTFFEYFVYSSLSSALSKNKLDKIKKKEGCGCMVGISEVCERGIQEHFGVEFGDTAEFKSLRDNALKYRNQIVHGELLQSIDKETCDKAIESVRNAQEYLIKNVFDKPSTNE